MDILIGSKNFFVVLNRGQTVSRFWLILLAKILPPLVCTVWHSCFCHGHHVRKLGNILMKKRKIGMFYQSDYLANILAKYIFRVYGTCSANHFFYQYFHPYQTAPTCWFNIDQLAGQHVGAVCPRLQVYEHKILPLIFGEILFQMIDF